MTAAEASTQPGTRDSALAALAGQATAAAGPGRVLTRSKLCTLQRSILCRPGPDRHGPGRPAAGPESVRAAITALTT